MLVAAAVGLVAGTLATAISGGLYRLEDLFSRLPLHWMWWPALGGIVVGVGGYFEPRVLGVGYDVIGDILEAKLAVSAVLALVGVKALIWVVSLASGTSGGVLAPLLMIGAAFGLVESSLIPPSLGSPSLWALVSMAAILGGMMRSPFMASFFAVELTHDLEALPEIFVAAICAHALTVIVMKRSILTEKLARRGYDIFREYGIDPLERVRVSEVMRPHRDTSTESPSGAFVYAHDSCRVAAEQMAKRELQQLAVVSPIDDAWIGMVTLTDLLKARLRQADEEEVRERPVQLGMFPSRLLSKGSVGK